MLQDNGNVVAFCSRHNHENIIVNIPELVQSILGGQEELTEDAEKIQVTIASIDEGITDVNLQRTDTESVATEQPAARAPKIRTPKVKAGA